MEIRPAKQRELAAIVATFGQREFFTDRLARQARDEGVLLVAWRGERPVGDVFLWLAGEDDPAVGPVSLPQLNHLEVLPTEQQAGIGTALVEAAEAVVQERGRDRMHLAVGLDNTGARRLYERLGYVDSEEEHVLLEWRDEDGTEHRELCLRMIKLLIPGVPGLDRWRPWTPREVADRLAGTEVPWFVAAGWAMELFLAGNGHGPHREHSDTEIAIPRADFPELREKFTDFDLYAAGGGLRPLVGEPEGEGHQVWVLDPAEELWRLDIFLEPGDRTTWVSHRDDRIRVPLAEATLTTADGIRFLRPEIVLFTKAKHRRPKDERDLAAALPRLDVRAREWLLDALTLVYGDHPWRDHLTGARLDDSAAGRPG